jgi:peptidoglycan hydrolase-like protein with peptidoglycan-binding domain
MNGRLSHGDRGPEVRAWQIFLAERAVHRIDVDGVFGMETEEATRRFQALERAVPDGVVGPETIRRARARGFDNDPHAAPAARPQPAAAAPMSLAPPAPSQASFLPPPPPFRPILTTAQRQALFGAFAWEAAPRPDNHEAIRILDRWEEQSIVPVSVPQLAGFHRSRVRFHRKAAAQLQALFAAWGSHGLLDRILTYDGGFVPRLMRGSATVLSAHAFGSAIDLNAGWNPLGRTPALGGRTGSVATLVAIANDNGFFWGGHFQSRPDGMHFEIAKLL